MDQRIKKFSKELLDHPAVRCQTDDQFLIVTILGYDSLGIHEVAKDFNFKHDLWYLVSRNKLTEETYNKSIEWFNNKYDNICSSLERYKFEEIKEILITVTQLAEKNELHSAVFAETFWDKDTMNAFNTKKELFLKGVK